MDSFTRLLQTQPLVFFHLVTAFLALVVGIVIMRRRKGSTGHRVLGWTWVALMGATALASAFIRNPDGVNLAGFSPIHVFTAVVAVMLPRGILYIRRGNVAAHRKTMSGLFIGAGVLAGVFTLLPGRFLGQLLWQQWLGLA
jgi:uncharacterized membrane protein